MAADLQFFGISRIKFFRLKRTLMRKKQRDETILRRRTNFPWFIPFHDLSIFNLTQKLLKVRKIAYTIIKRVYNPSRLQNAFIFTRVTSVFRRLASRNRNIACSTRVLHYILSDSTSILDKENYICPIDGS